MTNFKEEVMKEVLGKVDYTTSRKRELIHKINKALELQEKELARRLKEEMVNYWVELDDDYDIYDSIITKIDKIFSENSRKEKKVDSRSKS